MRRGRRWEEMGKHFNNHGGLLPGRHQSREVVDQDRILLASLGAIERGRGGAQGTGMTG